MAHNLEKNKIFASILVALLVLLVGSLLSEALVHPKPLEENIYVVEEGAPKDQSEKPKDPSIEEAMSSADVAKGKTVARKCLQCHSFDKQAPHRLGPRLWGIFRSQKSHHKDYPYSSAARKQEGVWDLKALDAFLKKPQAYMPGTKMSFIGLKKIKDRANLLAYLKTLKG